MDISRPILPVQKVCISPSTKDRHLAASVTPALRSSPPPTPSSRRLHRSPPRSRPEKQIVQMTISYGVRLGRIMVFNDPPAISEYAVVQYENGVLLKYLMPSGRKLLHMEGRGIGEAIYVLVNF
ncbi:RNA-binding (RRM/RBD/RNP motifs) family protein [Striga asiatica]|uniref:RNA-binding (RRM/RBD/RNP motifs) family protein n=1 Tax=Striga asiatica TaxID=4170 RepID=A0A5A7P6T3_STRAF|nr:RNA-binding (RRM/RBD/RNP motifs) family protein [Striga asiatica]